MKKIYFLLLISTICFSQEVTYERFSISDKKIIWQNVYQKDSIYNIENLKKIPSLKFNSESVANVVNQKLNCKGLAIYTNSSFGFNILIEEKQDKYRVTVTNIAFDSNLEVTIGYVTSSQKVITIEEAELRTSDFKFRKNNQSKTNLTCLDNFFLEYFKLNPTKDW